MPFLSVIGDLILFTISVLREREVRACSLDRVYSLCFNYLFVIYAQELNIDCSSVSNDQESLEYIIIDKQYFYCYTKIYCMFYSLLLHREMLEY